MQSALNFIHKVDQVIINPLITLLFIVALLIFMYGVFEYVRDSNSGSGREDGRRHILAGVFGLFIMVSVFGIIQLVLNTVGASSSDTGVSQITGQ